MGGKPSRGTPADMRLKRNKNNALLNKQKGSIVQKTQDMQSMLDKHSGYCGYQKTIMDGDKNGMA